MAQRFQVLLWHVCCIFIDIYRASTHLVRDLQQLNDDVMCSHVLEQTLQMSALLTLTQNSQLQNYLGRGGVGRKRKEEGRRGGREEGEEGRRVRKRKRRGRRKVTTEGRSGRRDRREEGRGERRCRKEGRRRERGRKRGGRMERGKKEGGGKE